MSIFPQSIFFRHIRDWTYNCCQISHSTKDNKGQTVCWTLLIYNVRCQVAHCTPIAELFTTNLLEILIVCFLMFVKNSKGGRIFAYLQISQLSFFVNNILAMTVNLNGFRCLSLTAPQIQFGSFLGANIISSSTVNKG